MLTVSRRLPSLRAALAAIVFAAALPTFAAAPEEAARRYLLSVYEGHFDGLLRSPAADVDSFERAVRNVLRVRCLRVDAIITRETATGSAVSVDAGVTISKSDRQTPGAWMPPETIPLRLTLVPESGDWVVSSVESLDDTLVRELVAAEEPERSRLLREHTGRISKNLARALCSRAMADLNSGKFDRALRGATVAREVAAMAGDRGGESLAVGALTMHAVATGDKESAVRLGVESLAIAETTADPDVLARAWYNRGRSFKVAGDARERAREWPRMECYRKALLYAPRAEDPTIEVRVLYSMANITANAWSDQLAARELIDRSLSLAREIGDPVGEMAGETVLATIYLLQGDRERGLFHHSRALALAEKHQMAAYSGLLVRSGQVLADEGRFAEARTAFAKVITRDAGGALKSTISPKGLTTNALISLAKMEAEDGRLDEAECLLREAASFRGVESEAYGYVLAPYYLKRRSYAAALERSLASLTETTTTHDDTLEALVSAARAYRELGDSDRALSAAMEAIGIRESMNARTAGDEQQGARVSDLTAPYYELAAEIALDRGDRAEALVFLERGRAVVLREILENGRPDLLKADPAVATEQANQEREIARLRKALERARATGSPDADTLARRLGQARAVYATFLDGTRARAALRLATRKHADSHRLREVLEHLPPRTVAIEYLVTDERLHVFVAKPGSSEVIHRESAVGRQALEERVDHFVEAVSQRRADVRTPARELYRGLIRPLESEYSGADAVVVIPDDVLWRVPFAALADERGRFVVERHAIVYAPSITAYALMAGSRRTAAQATPSFFAVGNPAFDETTRKAVASFYRATLDGLPEAEREIEESRAFYGRSRVLRGEQATEARTKSGIAGAAVVHFATHALFDDANPMYSRLALARDPTSSADDGWLEAWEIMRLDLDADLVVLSACETARGRIGAGEGVVGMAWSFFIAGARSTLAAQWKVSSASSADLMIAFHKALHDRRAGLPLRKALSLRDAQLRLLRDPRYEHPFYWAAFVIVGDAS